MSINMPQNSGRIETQDAAKNPDLEETMVA